MIAGERPGEALARAAVTALVRAGSEMRERGSFGWAADSASAAEVARLLGGGAPAAAPAVSLFEDAA